MSTRSQLRFVDANGNDVAQLYKHSDGYPSNIVPLLGELRDVLDQTGWQRGPGYAASQFILLDKLGGLRFCADKLADKFAEAEAEADTESDYGLYAELQEQEGVGPAKALAATAMADLLTDLSSWDDSLSAYFMGGHGVESGNIHGDEEYIYEVVVPYHRQESDGWQVKVSNRFESPQWETKGGEFRGYDYGEGEDAWTECEWAFDGSLDAALTVVEERGEDERAIDALENSKADIRSRVDASSVAEKANEELGIGPSDEE